MKIISQPVLFSEMWASKEIDFGDIIKIVVDLEKEVIAIDAELHSDLEALLLSESSDQKNLWGANLVYSNDDYSIEYTSFINIRPSHGNRSMEIVDTDIQNQVKNLVTKLILV